MKKTALGQSNDTLIMNRNKNRNQGEKMLAKIQLIKEIVLIVVCR